MRTEPRITLARSGAVVVLLAAGALAACGLIGPDVWLSAAPPAQLRFCGRDYVFGERRTDPLNALAPVIEAHDGQPLVLPDDQSRLLADGSRECASLLAVHDEHGWVVYSLVGAP
jgi:hypothetical protein